MMEFKFDPNQGFQRDAISAVVDLFTGQPRDAGALLTKLEEIEPQHRSQLFASDIGAVGNNLVLDEPAILQNLQKVQDRNGLQIRDQLEGDTLSFDVEMETGTGKTLSLIHISEPTRRTPISYAVFC